MIGFFFPFYIEVVVEVFDNLPGLHITETERALCSHVGDDLPRCNQQHLPQVF